MRALKRILNVRDLWSITRKAAAAWVSDDASSMGAALAYYSLFSIAPVLIIALAIVGYVFCPEVAQQQVLSASAVSRLKKRLLRIHLCH